MVNDHAVELKLNKFLSVSTLVSVILHLQQ